MHRRPSLLPNRPKTSAAPADDRWEKRYRGLKRSASQTFHWGGSDARKASASLDSVDEGAEVAAAPSASHCYPLSHAVVYGYKSIRRRLSASCRASGQPNTHPYPHLQPPSQSQSVIASSYARSKPASDDTAAHNALPDAAEPVLPPPPVPSSVSNRLLRRLGSIRHRRPATSGPSGDTARFNPAPASIPANYPTSSVTGLRLPGSAARAAAAAANDARREAEQTTLFLQGDGAGRSPGERLPSKDSESGVGMCCLSDPVESGQNVMLDPVAYLPSEISSHILSFLDVASLAYAERVSRAWNRHASDSLVWRAVFLRAFEPKVHFEPSPVTMGGAGAGAFVKGKPAPGQRWKEMYRVRKTIARRWKVGTPNAIYFNGHTDSVYCCQFDEHKVITGSRDRTIRVWDMRTFQCTKVIGGPANMPVAHTPPPLETHSDTVVSRPSLNGTNEGRAVYQVPSDYHDQSILCLQYDDRILVTGSSDHTCIVWDITGTDYEPLYRLRRHKAGVLDVCLDHRYIITCSKDATINVWDRTSGALLRTLSGHRGPVNAVQLRGNLLVSASGDGVAKLWNLEAGVCVKEFPSQDRGLAAVEFSDDAAFVLAGGNDQVVYKFDAGTGQLMHTATKHGGLLRSLFLDAHNGRIISGSYDQSIRVADFASGEIVSQFQDWTTSWILSAKSDYRRVVATSQDGRALVLDFGWGVTGRELLQGC